MLSGGAAASTEETKSSTQTVAQAQGAQTHGTDVAVGASDAAFDAFLDRLMRAESNGVSHAKNPRSSALGPFQFINSTFLAVMRQHFPDDIARLGESDILALRTKRDVARRAAKAFSKDNMAYLMERGVTPTFGHLRLAFLLGPEGASRVLTAPPRRPLASILEGAVIVANPFMRGMTAADLVARATRDVSPKAGDSRAPTIVAEAAPAPAPAAKAEPEQAGQPVHVAEAELAAATEAEHDALAGSQAPVAPAPEIADATAVETKAPEARAPEARAPEARAPEAKVAEAKVAEAKAAPAPGRITARRLDRPAVINVKCDSRLASCRRWIDQEVARILVAER
jgi:hypothetical protein